MPSFRSALLIGFLLFTSGARADLVLSAPPREGAKEATALYQPLADVLTRAIGQKVVYETPANWSDYGEKMRAGHYDLVLDGPHFVAWRMAHLQHVPLVSLRSLEGSLSFFVLARDSGPKALKDLRFGQVCSMASPNLAALVMLAQFDPFRSPSLLAPRGGVKGAFEAFEEGRCEATALPNYFVDRIPANEMARLRVLYASKGMPNLALTAGPRVPADRREKIIETLTSREAQADLRDLLMNQGGKKGGVFVRARPEDYPGQEHLLEGVIWGW